MVGQSPFFFSGSVRENLTFFNEDYSEECLMEAIRDAEADEMIRKLPYGLEHRLTEGGGNLSGGQRQRLEIARALYRFWDLLHGSAFDTTVQPQVNFRTGILWTIFPKNRRDRASVSRDDIRIGNDRPLIIFSRQIRFHSL